MKFNAQKCYILPTTARSSFLYSLGGVILKQVQQSPYLGVHISADLKWYTTSQTSVREQDRHLLPPTEPTELPPGVSVLGIHCSDQVLAGNGIQPNGMGSILEAGCRPSIEGTTPSSPLHQEGLLDERETGCVGHMYAPGAKPATTAGTKEAATADSPLQDCEGPNPSHASREFPNANRQK